SRMRDAGSIDIAQSGLPPVGAGDPAEEMVEGAVLHHQQDHVLDVLRILARFDRGGAGLARCAVGCRAATGESEGEDRATPGIHRDSGSLTTALFNCAASGQAMPGRAPRLPPTGG